MSDTASIVGRVDEIHALRAFVDSSSDGPMALVLTGEPGIGKSTLWREGLRFAEERGFGICRCRPVDAEAQLAFASLSDLLVDVADDELGALPQPQRRALGVALLRAEPDGLELPPRAVAVATLGLLQHLARQRPIVVGIDDAQWMDQPSQRVLAFVVRRLRTERVGFLIATRAARENSILDDVEQDAGVRVVEQQVVALDTGQVDTIVRERVGDALSPREVQKLHEMAGGNPMFALHLARAWVDRGAAIDGSLPVPDTLLSVVGDRLDGLGPAIEVVQVAAMLRRPTVSTVTGLLGPGAFDQLRSAESAGVVTLDGERVLLAHPLLGSAAYSRLDSAQRAQLHARVAATVDDIEEQGRHLALAADGPDAAVAEKLDHAAHRAGARGAPDASAELWEAAARFTPADQREAALERRLNAARCVFELGRVEWARAKLDDLLLVDAPAGPTRAQALALRAWAVASLEGFGPAAQCFQSALDEVDAGSTTEIEVLQGLAWSRHHNDVPQAEELARRAVALAELVGDDEQIAVSQTLVDFLCSLGGKGISIDAVTRAVEVLQPSSRRLQIMCRPDWLHGMLLMWEDRLPEALQRFQTMRADAIARGDEQSLPFVLFHLARAELLLGSWTTAVATAAECVRSTIESGQDSERPFSILINALVSGHLGDVAAAELEIVQGIALAERFGAGPALLELLATRGFLELSVGRFDDADRTLGEVARMASDVGLLEPGLFRYHGDAIEAKIALGRLDEAEALIDTARAAADALHRPWLDLVVGRGTAALRAARGDLDGASELLSAVLHSDRARQPFERARTELVLGTVHRRNRQKRAARAALLAAEAEFSRLGARIWLYRARSELSRVGGRAPSDDLTPTERQVAELIAAGRTYREAAAELFISPKTVQWNLSKVYSKLGIRSRAELPGRLKRD